MPLTYNPYHFHIDSYLCLATLPNSLSHTTRKTERSQKRRNWAKTKINNEINIIEMLRAIVVNDLFSFDKKDRKTNGNCTKSFVICWSGHRFRINWMWHKRLTNICQLCLSYEYENPAEKARKRTSTCPWNTHTHTSFEIIDLVIVSIRLHTLAWYFVGRKIFIIDIWLCRDNAFLTQIQNIDSYTSFTSFKRKKAILPHYPYATHHFPIDSTYWVSSLLRRSSELAMLHRFSSCIIIITTTNIKAIVMNYLFSGEVEERNTNGNWTNLSAIFWIFKNMRQKWRTNWIRKRILIAITKLSDNKIIKRNLAVRRISAKPTYLLSPRQRAETTQANGRGAHNRMVLQLSLVSIACDFIRLTILTWIIGLMMNKTQSESAIVSFVQILLSSTTLAHIIHSCARTLAGHRLHQFRTIHVKCAHPERQYSYIRARSLFAYRGQCELYIDMEKPKKSPSSMVRTNKEYYIIDGLCIVVCYLHSFVGTEMEYCRGAPHSLVGKSSWIYASVCTMCRVKCIGGWRTWDTMQKKVTWNAVLSCKNER